LIRAYSIGIDRTIIMIFVKRNCATLVFLVFVYHLRWVDWIFLHS